MIDRITLLGSSSGRNAGDAALISGIMESIDASIGRSCSYEIPTIKPGFVARSYAQKVVPISMLPWHASLKMLGVPTFRSIHRTDLSLIFDAILFDRALYNPLFNHLSSLYLMLPAAKRRGKKLGCFNVGVGPVSTAMGKKMLRELSELMDFITVRDEDSLTLLRDIGVKNDRLLVTADAALNVHPSSPERAELLLQRHGFASEGEILAVNVSAYLDTWAGGNHEPMGKERFVRIYSAALNRAVKELGVPVLFVGTQYHDVDLTRAIMDATIAPHKALFANREYSHYDIKAVLGRVSLLFAMRLHAVILASSELTPVIALPHQPKVVHYLRTLGLEERAITFDRFSEEELSRHIVKGWTERHSIRDTLGALIPIQKARANMASRLVVALDQGRDIEQLVPEMRKEISGYTPLGKVCGSPG